MRDPATVETNNQTSFKRSYNFLYLILNGSLDNFKILVLKSPMYDALAGMAMTSWYVQCNSKVFVEGLSKLESM